MMNNYYFPIQSTSLAHYFGSAIIKPAKYFSNKPSDIQDNYNEFLLFTNKFGTSETDCCLEIVLTDDEAKELIDVGGSWYLYDVNPLPITRIRKIYFSNKEKKDTTITNIRMSTAYVPESLIGIRPFDNNPFDSIKLPSDLVVNDKKNDIEKYDRFLGALALMRTAGEPYMNYAQNYIYTLSFFNSIIKEQVRNVYGFENFKKNFQGIFDNSNGFEHVIHYLNQPIDEQVLYEIAEKNKQEIKKDRITRVIDIDSITDTWTYTIAVLNTYGVGEEARRKKIDGLIQSHFSEIKKEKAEGVALCYGYNRGYSVFTKDYGIEASVPVKYKLQSKLDYYTIESVFQYVFNGVVSSSFPYLDNWCPQLPVKYPKRKTDYVILDEVVIGKKKAKVFSEEWWIGLLPKFHREFSSLAKPIFAFFQNIAKEMEDEINEEKKEIEAAVQDKLDETLFQIEKTKELLAQKVEESEKLKKELTQKDRERDELKIMFAQKAKENDELKEVLVRIDKASVGLKEELAKKTKENEELKELLLKKREGNEESQNAEYEINQTPSVSYCDDVDSIQTIASEPEIEYGSKVDDTFEEKALKRKTKDELLEIAKKRGLQVSGKTKKDDLVKLLSGATNTNTNTNDLFSLPND